MFTIKCFTELSFYTLLIIDVLFNFLAVWLTMILINIFSYVYHCLLRVTIPHELLIINIRMLNLFDIL